MGGTTNSTKTVLIISPTPERSKRLSVNSVAGYDVGIMESLRKMREQGLYIYCKPVGSALAGIAADLILVEQIPLSEDDSLNERATEWLRRARNNLKPDGLWVMMNV